MDLSADGSRVITSGHDGHVKIWSLATGGLLKSYDRETGLGDGGTNAAIWVDGPKKFAFGREDGTVALATTEARRIGWSPF